MGSTYRNTIVKGPAQEQIVAALMEQQHDALVSPTLDDLMLVYTPDVVWSAAAEHLPRTLHCAALFAVVNDSDSFEYHLYDDGHRVDRYSAQD